MSILCTVLWIAWPYYAAYDLAIGLRNGDETTLQNRVDWESVRQSLRGDLNASLLKSASKEQNELGRGFAVLLGPTFVNQIVDGYVTPQSIARLMKNGSSERTNQQENLPRGSDVQKIVHDTSANQISYAFFSGNPISFRIVVRPKNKPAGGVVTLMFRWSGNWVLTRVTLPLDEIEKFSEQAHSLAPTAPVAAAQSAEISAPQSSAKSAANRQPLSEGEMSAMRSRLASLWNVQPGVEHPEELYVTVRIRLNPDRRLAGPPQVVSTGSSPRYQAAANAAVQAVMKGQPYTMLRDESYDEWKYMDIDFDPTQMFVGGR